MEHYFLPYLDFLESFDWDLNCTLTSPYHMSQDSAYRAVERFESNFKKAFTDYRYFFTIEAFESKSYHVHLIIYAHDQSKSRNYKRTVIQNSWDKAVKSSRKTSSHISKHRKNENAFRYIMKHIHKGKIGYGIGGNYWENKDNSDI